MNDERSSPGQRGSRFMWVAALLVIAAVGAGWAIGHLQTQPATPTEPQAPPARQAGRGDLLFQVHCASCHGAEGHGDGVTSATLRPPPRDFASRPWRFEPTKESIRRIIRDGIPGTAMPAARTTLSDLEIEALVEHVDRLGTVEAPSIHELSADERLLRDAGFVDLRGMGPPPLTVSDAGGNRVKLADLKGRLVVVNFWGTACPHCLKEIPNLRKLEIDHAGRALTVLHVCADADDAREAQKALDQLMPGLRALADETGLGLARFEVQALPATWLIDSDGKAIGRSHGARDWTSLAMRDVVWRWLPAETPGPTLKK